MSWGVYYTYNGYINGTSKSRLKEKKQECIDVNEMLWNQILAMMAMTPPAYAENENGDKYPWSEYLDMTIREWKEEIESNCMLIARIDDCLEAIEENPEGVTEG